ncbi:MAG: hypothetical protein NTW04_00480 [Elusimicrobia bacterium]|nr:hypothetical protein [Elusimicrobiota bacterium]
MEVINYYREQNIFAGNDEVPEDFYKKLLLSPKDLGKLADVESCKNSFKKAVLESYSNGEINLEPFAKFRNEIESNVKPDPDLKNKALKLKADYPDRAEEMDRVVNLLDEEMVDSGNFLLNYPGHSEDLLCQKAIEAKEKIMKNQIKRIKIITPKPS